MGMAHEVPSLVGASTPAAFGIPALCAITPRGAKRSGWRLHWTRGAISDSIRVLQVHRLSGRR